MWGRRIRSLKGHLDPSITHEVANGRPPGTHIEGWEAMDIFVLRTWLQAKFAKDERGAGLVEYILLVALIALAVIAAVVFLRGEVSSKFSEAGSRLSTGS